MSITNKMNKKSQAFYLIWHIFRVIFVILIFISVVLLIKAFIRAEIPLAKLSTETFFNRLFYSPNAISYQNPYTSRAYPGVIDLNKFEDSNIEKAIEYPKDSKVVAAKLTLTSFNDGKVGDVPVKEAYYQKTWYERWLPLTAEGVKGKGAATEESKTFFVAYVQNGQTKEGILTIDIVVPNS